jgi:hypothetical protein
MTTKSGAIARKSTAILIISVLVIGSGIYVAWLHETGQPPFCHGYPPGGDCPGNYSYTFTISVNYAGPWRLTYQGYASGGESNPTSAKGSLTGSGPYTRFVTLSGPNNNGLTLCAMAEKLDGSNSTLTLMITGNSETSLPYGATSYCGGVYP